MRTRFSQEGALYFILLNRKTAFPGSRRVLRASMIPLVLDMDAIVYPLALVLPLVVHYCLACQIVSMLSNITVLCKWNGIDMILRVIS